MKYFFKKSVNIIILTFVGMLVGYLLMTIAFCVPESWIRENSIKSAEIISAETTYPTIFVSGSSVDNWTDSNCISIAYNTDSSNPFYNALNSFQYTSDYDQDSVVCLEKTFTGEFTNKESHTWLWNGFRTWLRPLLAFFTIADIRYLLVLVNIVLLVLVCQRMVKITGRKMSYIPFVVPVLYFNFILESISLLYFVDISCMFLGMLAVQWALEKDDREKYLPEIFAGIGVVLSFNSMLIMPLITLGFPLIMWLSYTNTTKNKFVAIIKYCVSWLAGYAITMATKVAISYMFFNGSDAGNALIGHYSGTNENTLPERIKWIFHIFGQAYKDYPVGRIILIVLIVVLIILTVKKHILINDLWRKVCIFLVAMFPVVWVFVMTGHAGHGWTVFNVSISIYAVLEILWRDVSKEIKTEE